MLQVYFYYASYTPGQTQVLSLYSVQKAIVSSSCADVFIKHFLQFAERPQCEITRGKFNFSVLTLILRLFNLYLSVIKIYKK